MIEFDDKFIDVNFQKDAHYARGCLDEPPYGLFGNMADYESIQQPLTDAQLRAFIEERDANEAWNANLIARIFSQSNEGSCVANAYGQACEMMQAKQVGRENVIPVSPISLYKRIGRSASSGATMSAGASEFMSRGIIPLDTPANRERFGDVVMPHTGWRTPMPRNWEPVAAQFAGSEAFLIRTYQALKTACALGHLVAVGRQGHAILYCDLLWRGSAFGHLYPNSWAENWGMAFAGFRGGFGIDTESQMRQSASWAVAIRSVRFPHFFG